MKKLTLLFTLFGCFSLSFGQENTDLTERVIHFHSDIEILQDSKVKITETIKVYVAGIIFKHGVYRELPLSYEYKGGNVHVGFELLSVKKNGKVEPYHTQKMSNGIVIYAGERAVFLDEGVYTYEITYEVSDVLLYNEKFDELYWNVNGNGWGVKMDELTATVYSPKGASIIQHEGYTGYYGSEDKGFTVEKGSNSITYKYDSKVKYYENLSVAVAWDKGFVAYPTFFDKLWLWIKTYILYVIGLFGLLANVLFNYKRWKKHGVDPKPGVIIPRYHAPEDLSPAECAYLMNEGRPTNSMFGSVLVDLAMKGYLKMDMEKKGLIFKHNSYTFTKLGPKDTPKLNDIEVAFYDKLFKGKTQISIEKGVYNSGVKSTRDNLMKNIDKKQDEVYYLRNQKLTGRPFLFTIGIAALGFIGYNIYGGAIGIIIVAAVFSLIINALFMKWIEQPTRLGREKMDEIEGFKMYMKYADKERIKLMNPPEMDFTHFEENLPYAIALGVAEEWAGKFDPKEIEQGMMPMMPYYTGANFANLSSIGDDLATTISSAAVPPSKSGGGNFSGGGGFSGGGFGGGGGGGW